MSRWDRNASKKNVGTLLIWVGVLAWTPYIYLVTNGHEASIWPYLTVHLLGSFIGGKLRGPLPENVAKAGGRRLVISRAMIYLGVMAWLPYIYLDSVVGASVSITPFLTVHLIGVLGGILVRVSLLVHRIQKTEKFKAEMQEN